MTHRIKWREDGVAYIGADESFVNAIILADAKTTSNDLRGMLKRHMPTYEQLMGCELHIIEVGYTEDTFGLEVSEVTHPLQSIYFQKNNTTQQIDLFLKKRDPESGKVIYQDQDHFDSGHDYNAVINEIIEDFIKNFEWYKGTYLNVTN